MPEQDPHLCGGKLSRRTFIGAASAAAGLPLIAEPRSSVQPTAAQLPGPHDVPDPVRVTLDVNGQTRLLSVDARTTLLDALRDHLGLTGTKKGCGHGQCGACTVHRNRQRILSCMTFAVMCEGAQITTIEGLAQPGGALHPMQQAFIDQDGFQCGYCTPGQIMSAVACVEEGHAHSPEAIREYMSGNLCRCAAYPNIVAAIQQAASARPRS